MLETLVLADAPLAVIDVETTGLDPVNGHRVIEVAVVCVDGGLDAGQFVSLIRPDRPIDPGAAAVNGISDAMVADAPSFREILPLLDRVLHGRVLVAHNAPFDLGFLDAEYRRAGARFAPRPVLDTCRFARRNRSFPDNRLATVVRSLGVRSQPSHRALADVYATLEVCRAFAREIAADDRGRVADFVALQGGSIAWPSHVGDTLPDDDLLARALRDSLRVRVTFVDRSGQASDRVIRPTGFLGECVIAHCELRNEERSFRIDRITRRCLAL